MTAEEYLDKVRINEIPYNIIMFKPIEVIQMLQDFARLKCKEQRELCAKEIKRNAVIFDILGINQETILNSPEPEI
jgi:spore coat polysaccharide biosynthesis predicted glycosyltransferase SpsG